MNGSAGKGDTQRPSLVSREQYEANWLLAFPPKEIACGPGTTTEIGTLSPSGSIDEQYAEDRMNALTDPTYAPGAMYAAIMKPVRYVAPPTPWPGSNPNKSNV